MSQVHDSPKRIGRYDSATIHEALRLNQSGLQNTEVAHQLGIPEGSVGRLIKVARLNANALSLSLYEHTDSKQDEPPPPVEQLQIPKALADFFDWLVKRAYAAEDEATSVRAALLETQNLLAEKSAEAERAWAELNAQVKTQVSRELASVYEEYKSASRSSWKGGQ